jgi:hypothetical protein
MLVIILVQCCGALSVVSYALRSWCTLLVPVANACTELCSVLIRCSLNTVREVTFEAVHFCIVTSS